MSKDLRDLRPGVHYGPTFWQVLGLLAHCHFDNKAELVKELTRINRKPVARQQVYTIIKTAIEAGFLDGNPFEECPQMSRRN
ncbi:hypothetical protein LCGC14_2535760 [marine sediment metagenome]|uniref:Uncharacterized protein n=1 Tax=marine sediment metagenome TaxID=412755 RepID=A0A0F9AS78_9ZZZZ